MIFIPHELCMEEPGFVLGKVVYDTRSDIKKFYIVTVRKEKTGPLELTKSPLGVIGYYSEVTNKKIAEFANLKLSDYIHITAKSSKTDYYLKNIVLNNKKVNLANTRTTIILYCQRALLDTELFESKAKSGDHFYELTKLIQSKKDELRTKSSFQHIWETILRSLMLFYLYPVLLIFKVIEKLLSILKYSYLGLHMYGWLENIKWMLLTVIHDRGFKLKTANYGLAIFIDMALGIYVLRLLQYYVDDQPSQLLLNNAEVSLQKLCVTAIFKYKLYK